MDSIEKYISEERDVLYLRGLDKGEATAKEQQQTKFVTNLLTETDFSIERVAEIADVSVDFVKMIQQKIAAK